MRSVLYDKNRSIFLCLLMKLYIGNDCGDLMNISKLRRFCIEIVSKIDLKNV